MLRVFDWARSFHSCAFLFLALSLQGPHAAFATTSTWHQKMNPGAEGRTCSFVDLRPELLKRGLPAVRHQGNFDDSRALVLSDLLSFREGRLLSALDLKTMGDQAPSPRELTRALNQQGTCLESDLPSHDRSRSSAQAKPSSPTCSSRHRFTPPLRPEEIDIGSPSNLNSLESRLDSHGLTAIELPSRVLTPPGYRELQPRLRALVVGRRFSFEKERCEYLLRMMEGPSCERFEGTDLSCERGSVWIPRASVQSRASLTIAKSTAAGTGKNQSHDKWDCAPVLLKSTENGQAVTDESTVCMNASRTKILSADCVGKHSCEALSSLERANSLDLKSLSSRGHTGFQLCTALGGKPEIVEARGRDLSRKEIPEPWQTIDRCVFGKDHSFIGTGSLAPIKRP